MKLQWMEQLTKKYVDIPHEYVYVHKKDFEGLEKGNAVLSYVNLEEAPKGSYARIKTTFLQPAIKIDDNTYDVVFILV